MNSQWEMLWARLVNAGVSSGTLPKGQSHESPWYVKALLGFCGWLAALFFLGFAALMMSSLLDSSIACFMVGGLMVGGAFALLRVGGNDFLEHLALAVSLAGQTLVVVAITFSESHLGGWSWCLIGFFQLGLAFVMPNFVHRVYSSFFAGIALSFVFEDSGWSHAVGGLVMFFFAFCWLYEFRYPGQMKRLQPIGYGLVFALVQIEGRFFYDSWFWGSVLETESSLLWIKPWMGELFMGLVLLSIVGVLLKRHGRLNSGKESITALVAVLLLSIISMKISGLAAGIAVIVLGFSACNRVLIGVGVVSLLFFVSSYYYQLETTLLVKSWTLLGLGLLLLLLRWGFMKWMNEQGESDHV